MKKYNLSKDGEPVNVDDLKFVMDETFKAGIVVGAGGTLAVVIILGLMIAAAIVF